MLSESAQQLIHDYLNLPFPGLEGVRCPYFKNAGLKQRAQLRVLVGKGTPKEIVEEAQIISLQYRLGIFDHYGKCCLDPATGDVVEGVRQCLIDRNLGIECSGFVTHVLDKHYLETKGYRLSKKLFKVSPQHIIRWLISLFRPVENIGVLTYANDENARKIDWRQSQSGDLIVILDSNGRNHIILISNNDGKIIDYVHARAWSSEGKYGHGVSEGKIIITNSNGNLLEQEWVERGLVGAKNETFVEAREAKAIEVRRLVL